MNFTAYRALVIRDLKLFFRDRRAVLMCFVAPILIGSFFGYLFGGARGESENSRIDVALIDQDDSPISRRIAKGFAGNAAISLKTASLDEAREQVRGGKLAVAVVIPKGFGDRAPESLFRPAEKPQIDLLYDPSHGPELAVVRGTLTQHVMESVSAEAFGSNSKYLNDAIKSVPQANGLSAADRQSLTQLLSSVQQWNARLEANPQAAGGARPGLSMPYSLREEAITARKGARYNAYGHSFAGMSVQFILMMGLEAGLVMIMQRQGGIWKRLRSAPISRFLIIAVRVTSATIEALLILLVVFGFARLVFGVRVEGSMPGFLLICLCFGLMTAAFGLLVAVSGKTVEATRGLAILTTLLMVMLGGAWVPAFLFPQWLQKVTFAVPTRWAIEGLDGMTWRGLGFDSAIAPAAALIGFSILFAGLALWRFRWESE